MIIQKKDEAKLSILAHGASDALEHLADLLYDYYAKETVICPLNQKELNSGKAQLALWLKTLPKGLRDGHDANG